MGSKQRFKIVHVFKAKTVFSLRHNKAPLGQRLVLLLGKGGCFTSLPYAALPVRRAEPRQSMRLQAREEDTVIPANLVFLATLSSCGTWRFACCSCSKVRLFSVSAAWHYNLLFELMKVSLAELRGPRF